MKKKRVFIAIIAMIVIIALPTVFWVSSLINCEILTNQYFEDFEKAYTQNPMLGEMEYFKILHCDDNTAEVYYVSQGMKDANVLSFENHNGTWTQTSWQTIWSTSGSASGVIYPYWWHFIYGGI